MMTTAEPAAAPPPDIAVAAHAAPRATLTTHLLFWPALMIAVALAATSRVPNSDLYMALAGGRDTAEGKLGQPDDWSYITEGRVWVSQNWLFNRGVFEIWRRAGERGLLTTRAVLVTLAAAAVLAWLRQRRFSWPAAIFATAAVLLACRYHMTLRGNMVTVIATPLLLWLLEKQRRGSIAWAAAILPLVAIWSQCHGGWVYAIGLLGLWCTAFLVPTLAGLGAWTWTRWTALVAAMAAGVGLAVLLSPFGFQVVSQSLSMASQTEWRTIGEWWPLVRSWADLKTELEDTFGVIGPYLVMLGAVAMLAAITAARAALRPGSTPQSAAGASWWADGPRVIFDVMFLIATIVMAFLGRRFVPLAAIALALPLAWSLDAIWCTTASPRRLRSAAAFVGALLLAATAFLTWPMLKDGYSDNHPFYRPQSAFDRQVMGSSFPDRAARFMRINRIAGNVFHDYTAEAYLRWTVPDVKVGCGGRAQQIYVENDLKAMRGLMDPRLIQPKAMATRLGYFEKKNVRTLLLPVNIDWELILALIDTQQWLAVYYDGEFCVLISPDDRTERIQLALMSPQESVAVIDPASDPGEQSATAAAQNKVVFGDELTRLRTLALFLYSPRLEPDESVPPAERPQAEEYIFHVRAAAIQQAQAARPDPMLYRLLDRIAQRRKQNIDDYLRSEFERFGKLPTHVAQGANPLRCRGIISSILAEHARQAGRADEAARWKDESGKALAELNKLSHWWQM